MGGMLDFISGAANAGAEIVGNRIAQAQKVDAEIDLQQRLAPIMEERERAAQKIRTEGTLAIKEGEVGIAEKAQARERERIAGYKSADEAAEAGDLATAKSRKELADNSQAELRAAQAKNYKARADLEEASTEAIKSGRTKNGATNGGSGLGQQKFEAAQIEKARDRYEKNFAVDDPMDPSSKKIDHVRYSSYNRRFSRMVGSGVDPSNAADDAYTITSIIADKAKKLGVPYSEAEKQYESALASARGKPAASDGPAPEKPAGGMIDAAPAPAKPAAVKPEDLGYSASNQTQFDHVLANLDKPSFRAQAESWLQGGGLSVGQRQRLERLLRR